MWSVFCALALFSNFDFTADRFNSLWPELFPPPQVVTVFPPEGAEHIFPYVPIFIRWNQPVTEDSLFAHLKIEPDLPVALEQTLHMHWDHEHFPGVFALILVPYLPPDTLVTLRIEPGVKSRDNRQESEAIFTTSFSTTALPDIFGKSF